MSACSASSRRHLVGAGHDEQAADFLESGRPCWVKPGEVWFHWGWVWEEITSRHETSTGERTRIRDMLTQRMKVDDLPHKRYRFASGRRNEYVVFTQPWIDAVQRLSAGSADSEEGYVENEASES